MEDALSSNPFVDASPFAEWKWRCASGALLSDDELRTQLVSGATSTYLVQAASAQYSVHGNPPPGPTTPGTEPGSPAALAIFTLHSPSSDPAVRANEVVCVLRGFQVQTAYKRQGLGHALFRRVHAFAFQMAQLRSIAEHIMPADAGSKSNSAKPDSFLFRLHEGCCFRSPAALLVYQRNGATVTAGTNVVEPKQLYDWAARESVDGGSTSTRAPGGHDAAPSPATPRQPIAFKPMDIEVIWDPLDLNAAYLEPIAYPGWVEERGGKAFTSLDDAGAVSDEAFDRRADQEEEGGVKSRMSLIRYNSELKLGALTIGGHPADQRTGCYRFAIPAWPCALLERYLRDPANTALCQSPDPANNGKVGTVPRLIVKRDRTGEPTVHLTGYNLYMSTAAKHSPMSQVRRTRLASTKVQKDALLALPGCKLMLTTVAEKLGWNIKYLSSPYQVHILLQDADLQGGFDWHTDGDGIKIANEHDLVTLSIQLSPSAVSAMWVHGFQPCIYGGMGSCVLFHGGCLHRTLPWGPAVARGEGRHPSNRGPHPSIVKVVFLYQPPC